MTPDFLMVVFDSADEVLMKKIEAFIDSRKNNSLTLLKVFGNRKYSRALKNICNYKTKATPLNLAKILLKYKNSLLVNINKQTGDMKRATIHYAALQGNQALYNFLIEHQADVTLIDKDDIRAEEYMNRHQNPEKRRSFCNHK